jgi:hypothetical protein
VNKDVIKSWIVQKVIEFVGGEDDLVVEYIFELLEDEVCSGLLVLSNSKPTRFFCPFSRNWIPVKCKLISLAFWRRTRNPSWSNCGNYFCLLRRQ